MSLLKLMLSVYKLSVGAPVVLATPPSPGHVHPSACSTLSHGHWCWRLDNAPLKSPFLNP